MRVPYLIRRPSLEQSLSDEQEGLFKPKAGLECAKEFSVTTHLYTSKTAEKNDFRLFGKGYQLSNRIFDDDIS